MGEPPDDLTEQRLKRLEAKFERLAELLREWLEEAPVDRCGQVA